MLPSCSPHSSNSAVVRLFLSWGRCNAAADESASTAMRSGSIHVRLTPTWSRVKWRETTSLVGRVCHSSRRHLSWNRIGNGAITGRIIVLCVP